MPEQLAADLILDARAQIGERPVWDDATGTRVWVDIMAEVVHRFDPRCARDRVVDVLQPVGAAVLRWGWGAVWWGSA